MATESRTPDETARSVAANAIPEVTEALTLMGLKGKVNVGDVVDGRGNVVITLPSSDAYELGRWVRYWHAVGEAPTRREAP
ncbi:hypothetical protein ABWK57_13875 [Streptomyces sp. NPDC094045]|uniref:hypothetical protein n=1 Tax=unclassified Streptomyces TaxID=2593676 RepID=UPI003394A8FE